MLTQYSQVENTSQILTFCLAILLGGTLCVVYDCYRSLLSHFSSPSFINHCADILYCVLSALTCFCFLLVECKGEIRIYAASGFALGFYLVRRFCSKRIRKLTRKLLKGISALVCLFLRPITRVILWCYRKISPILSKLPKTIKLFSKNKEKPLENDGTIDV